MRPSSGDGSGVMQRRWRFGASLALFSLLVQLAATFAHFHPEDFAFVARTSVAGAAAASVPAPAGGIPGLPSHDDCALCASLQLVGAAAMPEPVAVPLPAEEIRTVPTFVAAAARATPRHLLFQTRAPPFA
jgi:hypothetical protein